MADLAHLGTGDLLRLDSECLGLAWLLDEDGGAVVGARRQLVAIWLFGAIMRRHMRPEMVRGKCCNSDFRSFQGDATFLIGELRWSYEKCRGEPTAAVGATSWGRRLVHAVGVP